MNTFKLPTYWFGRSLRIALVGAGGTGYWLATELMMLMRLTDNLPGDGGISSVTIFDDKDVKLPNLARTGYLPHEVGYNKAEMLSNKMNMALGSKRFKSVSEKFTGGGVFDLVITATDSRSSRVSVRDWMLKETRNSLLWLDTGVSKATASAVLGSPVRSVGLPCTIDLFHEVSGDGDADTALNSCDMQTSIARQSFGINKLVATHAVQLLAQLLLDGEINHHGLIMDLKSGYVTPIGVNEEVWRSFGFDPEEAAA